MARAFRFDAELGQHLSQFGSDYVISRLFHSGDLHVGYTRLAPGGVIGLCSSAVEADNYRQCAVDLTKFDQCK